MRQNRPNAEMAQEFTSPRATRRTLLRGLAGATLAMPLLSTLPGQVRAQSAAFPKRFIAFFHSNGVIPEAWFPVVNPGVPSTEFTLQRCHAPLEPFKDKLVLFQGVDMSVCQIGHGEPHQRGMGAMLTGAENQAGGFVGGDGTLSGWSNGTSIDQTIASRIGTTTRFRSVELGVRADVTQPTGEIRSRMVYAGPANPLAPTGDPRQVFTRLFSDAQTDIAELQKQRLRRRSILDAVTANTDRLAGRISVSEKEKLERHLDLVRDLEVRLTAENSPGAACVVPGEPSPMAINDELTMQQISRAHIDMLVMSFACDQTRVGSIQYSNAKNHIRFPWLNSLGDGHGLSHEGDSNIPAREEWIARDTWYAGELAYLMQRLAEIPEGDGTLLDNTCILWVNELALGNAHSHLNMPFLLAGSAGGAIRTGQYLVFDAEPHNNMLRALLHAYGGDDTVVGHPDYNTRVMPGLLA
jgi:hypothetical protein